MLAAAFAMPYTADDASSWTIVRPPLRRISSSPAAPSAPIPVNSTPIPADPACSATERKGRRAGCGAEGDGGVRGEPKVEAARGQVDGTRQQHLAVDGNLDGQRRFAG